jgi:hypothetical protein
MYNECRHILPGGFKCKAAALKGKAFCFHHVLSRRPVNRGRSGDESMLALPSVEDAAGVRLAIDQVLSDFRSGDIDREDAGTLFYGLQIAASLIGKTSTDQHPRETVREIFKGDDCRPIGPETTGCDPEDCAKCTRRFNCEDNPSRKDEMETRFRETHLARKYDD